MFIFEVGPLLLRHGGLEGPLFAEREEVVEEGGLLARGAGGGRDHRRAVDRRVDAAAAGQRLTVGVEACSPGTRLAPRGPRPTRDATVAQPVVSGDGPDDRGN